MAKGKIIAKFSWLLVLGLIFLVFRSWFAPGEITAGDLGFFYPVNISEYWQLPLSWETFRNSGLGGHAVPFLGSYVYNLPIGFLSRLTTSFVLIERLVWLWPILGFSLLSARFLNRRFGWPLPGLTVITWLILFANSYFLMIVSGGQITVALAYSIFPLVFALFLRTNSGGYRFYSVLLFTVSLSLLVAFDLRYAYMFFMIVVIYLLIELFQIKFSIGSVLKLVKKYCLIFIPTGLISIGLHSYWLLSLIFLRRPSLPAGYERTSWVEFLSLADFSDSLGLLHPNWPEGIFGKTYFMRPEFLLLPILAFSSLLFTRIKTNKKPMEANERMSILFFAALSLVGAFLAKGSQPPFGEVYLWLFDHFPGFNMFRDPTKFYMLVALSYSVLIPFSLEQIGKQTVIPDSIGNLYRSRIKFGTYLYRFRIKSGMTKKIKPFKSFKYLVLGIFVFYWLFLIRPAWLGKLGGTFKARQVPQEYLVFKDFVSSQDDFFRTFWIPAKQRFGFYSNNHPAVAAESFVTDSVCREPFCSLKVEIPEEWGKSCPNNDRCYVRELSYLLNPKTEEVLKQMAVKYIIIPFDSQGEIFMAERQYNSQQRQEVEGFLNTIPWLKKVGGKDTPGSGPSVGRTPPVWKDMAIYEVSEPQDHFFIDCKLRNHCHSALDAESIQTNKHPVLIDSRLRGNDVGSGSRLNHSPALFAARRAGETGLINWRMVNPTKYYVSLKAIQPPVRLVFSETFDELWQAKTGGQIIPSVKYNDIYNSFDIEKSGNIEVVVEYAPQKYVYWGLMVSGAALLFTLIALMYSWRKK